MYEEYYKLQGKPFQLTSDPRFFFRSTGHQRAMAYLRYGLQQSQGFIVVTGDIGTGKTMLVNNLFREIEGQNVIAVKIVSTNVTEHDLLRLVAAHFAIPFERASKASLLTRLQRQFIACVEEGKRVLIVIDEGQNLPRSSLEELRMLSNFEHNGMPLVQSFLLGQREFRTTLRSPGLEQLRQRIIAAYHLKPLSLEETSQYIRHRLATVGWANDPQFEDAVFAGVYRFTGGVPRRINTLMDRLLLNGALEETHVITARELSAVTGEIDNEQGGFRAEDAEREHADQDAVEPLMEADTAASGPGRAAKPVRNPEIERLELRLAQMAQAVETLSQRVAPPPMATPIPIADSPEPAFARLGPEFWRFAIGGAVVFLILVAVAVVALVSGHRG